MSQQVQQQYQQQEEQKQNFKGQEQYQKQNLSNETFRRVKFQNGNFELIEDRLRNLADDECLIRVLFSSVNNYDKIIMENKKIQDYCLGSEGVGIIEKCGQNFDQNCCGKKVAFCGDGWSEFAIKKRDKIMMLDDNTDLKKAIDAFVSPLTALCLRRIILQNNHRSVVLDGASCHLGRTLIQLCKDSGIEVIAVVRSEDQIQEFRDQYNLKYVIQQDIQKIKDQFCSYIKEVEPQIYISCVGGDVTKTIFNCMPDKSCLVVVGNLSNEDLQLPITRLFVEGKQIKGFFLERYLKEELSQATFNQFCEEIKQDFKQGGKIFGVEAQKEMELRDWDKALDELQNLHGGKVLLRIGNQ